MLSTHTEHLVNCDSGIEQKLFRETGELIARLASLAKQVLPDASAVAGDTFHHQVLALLEQSQQSCRETELLLGSDSQAIAAAQEIFRLMTDPWLGSSWFADRARRKPSGFAGDYEMLLKIYERATPARGLGAYLDMCLMDLPLARAVRGRMKAVRHFLLDEINTRHQPVRVLNIASGPCREFLDWPATSVPAEIVAMDNDPLALEYVEHELVPQLPDGLKLQGHHYNALRTRSASATIRKFGKFDIIYSVGLCDYLSDSLLIRLIGGWKDTLEEGGVLYVAFKDAERYDKTPYQWHLDWHFHQRTKRQVLALFERAGFELDAIQTTRDESGVIINFISRHPAAEILRRDTPESGILAPKHLARQRVVHSKDGPETLTKRK